MAGDNTRTSEYFWHSMAHPAELAAKPPTRIVRGDGVYVIDGNGRRLLDATSGGLSVVNLGHSAAPIKAAIAEQLATLPYYAAFAETTNDQAEELSRILVEDWFAPEGMARVFFTSGGSDSVETALRIARQYWKIVGKQDRYKFIALRNAYHGSHFGGAALNARPRVRRNYEPGLPGVFHIPTPWTYRNPFDESDPERLGALCARMLQEEIEFQGPDTVAAFIAEPVLGAGGLIVPPENFWPRVRAVCDAYGVLLIADEVITCFGRTGAVCGSRGWGVKPDLLTTAKGITSGYFPFGATMINTRIAEAFEGTSDGIAGLGHGYTYSGHPVGCAAARATLAMTQELRVWDNASSRGTQLMSGLEKLFQKHAVIGDVRGKGLMAGIELVKDRKTKTPADSAMLAKFASGVADAGVMIRVAGNVIGVSPPLIVDETHIDHIVAALDAGLAKC